MEWVGAAGNSLNSRVSLCLLRTNLSCVLGFPLFYDAAGRLLLRFAPWRWLLLILPAPSPSRPWAYRYFLIKRSLPAAAATARAHTHTQHTTTAQTTTTTTTHQRHTILQLRRSAAAVQSCRQVCSSSIRMQEKGPMHDAIDKVWSSLVSLSVQVA